MANVRTANAWYVDTQFSTPSDDLPLKQIGVTDVLLTAIDADAVLVLSCPTTQQTILELRNATSGTTAHFRFSSNPITFPNGVRALTLTNAKATIIGRAPGST